MTDKPYNRFGRIRAFLGALTILLSAIAAPVTLATQTGEDVCAMVCCVEDGFCCCKPGKATVKGQSQDGKAELTSENIAQPCPEGCASWGSSIKTFSRDFLRAAAYQALSGKAVVSDSSAEPRCRLAVVAGSYAPRAPPSA